MKITKLTTFIMHVPVTKNIIGDSTHSITHWGMPGVMIETDTGLVGYGYTGTHADITTDRLITTIIKDAFGPMLIGEDASEVRYLHRKMSRSSTNIWVGRGGLMQMALSAIDIALWDLKAKWWSNLCGKSLAVLNIPVFLPTTPTAAGWFVTRRS